MKQEPKPKPLVPGWVVPVGAAAAGAAVGWEAHVALVRTALGVITR